MGDTVYASDMTPEQLAKACSENMHAEDFAAQALGITVEVTTPEYAELSMTVRKDMANGHGICHGGMIFAMADTAFAHSCNNTNKVTVASGCNIEYLAPAHLGDVLTATAKRRSRSGRTGVYDVEIKNQEGVLLALFRGKSYQIKGTLVPESGE